MADEPGTTRARSFGAPLEVAESDGLTVFGRLVPYGETATVNDGAGPYREQFARGAFEGSIARRGHDRIKLYLQHNRSVLPIGKMVEHEDREDGLHGAFQVSDTTVGRDAITAVNDDLAGGFSVGFRSLDHRVEDGVTVRTEADLAETSLVETPAYAGAEISGVRAQLDAIPPDEIGQWLDAADPAVVAAVRRWAETSAEPAADVAAGSAEGERRTLTIHQVLTHLRIKEIA